MPLELIVSFPYVVIFTYYDFAISYSRLGYLSSWTVDLTTRSWTNRYDMKYTINVNGPANGSSVIFYPAGKYLYASDPYFSYNRLILNSSDDTKMNIYTITQNDVNISFTYQNTINSDINGPYIYHMSSNMYNNII